MRKEKLIRLERETVKDIEGVAKTYFTEKEEVRTDYVLTVSEVNQRTYGYDPITTRQTQTRSNLLTENSYVKYEGQVFHIIQVIPYPRHNTVILKEVNTAND